MSEINKLIISKAKELLSSKKVDFVLGYKNDCFDYSATPFLFNYSNIDEFVYNAFCVGNLSKTLFLVQNDKKIAVFMKPCDTYSLKQLRKENKFPDDNIYVIGVECNGKCDIEKIKQDVNDTILSVSEDYDNLYVKGIAGEYTLNYSKDYFLDKCLYCRSSLHTGCDETIIVNQKTIVSDDPFQDVRNIEAMSSENKFQFWQKEFSKCIRCNACRNICPACTCNTCVFDNRESSLDGKVNANSFEEKLYHIIKSFHVAGRCTDCGECSRVCPVKIPLHLLNRKYIKEINDNFGSYDVSNDNANFPLSEFKISDKEVR